jgi:cardiolipin synthase
MVDPLNSPDQGVEAGSGAPKPPGGEISDRLLTVPNALCVLRLLGSLLLIGLAWMDHRAAFLWLFLALTMTDWLDGKLAILLKQRSVIGPRLDSWADATMYAALLIGVLLMHAATIRAELAWFVPPLATYALSSAAGLWKFKSWPSYHTRAAKTSWFLITVGAVCLLGGWALWPLRLALAAATLTNLEATLITFLSPVPRTNVESIYHVLRDQRHPPPPAEDPS